MRHARATLRLALSCWICHHWDNPGCTCRWHRSSSIPQHGIQKSALLRGRRHRHVYTKEFEEVFITESSTVRYVALVCLSQNPQQFAMYARCLYHRSFNNSLCTSYVFITESPTIRHVPLMCLSLNSQQFAMHSLCVYHRIFNNSLCTPYVFTIESLTIR